MLRDIRREYSQFELKEKDLVSNPLELFQVWMDDALKYEVMEPTAMTLSTCINEYPDSRVVLLKEVTERGFVFFSNYNSTKGNQILKNNNVAINFFWPELERQVRIKGKAKRTSKDYSSNYFKQRPRDSQLGALVSDQSKELEHREELVSRLDYLKKQYEGKEINKPDYWGGYIVSPEEIEFWQGRPNRLHDRIRYYRKNKVWEYKRLSP